jgi:DNA-binding response OmpR family regulator
MLVADDEPAVCETVKAGLEEYCGADVVCCVEGTTALDTMRRQRLDAAVIDVGLADINGFDLAEHAANLNVPVLLVPGHPDAIEICRRYGYPHLPKPFLPEALAERAIGIIRAAKENIESVQIATTRLKGTAANLADAVREATRTLYETNKLVARLGCASSGTFR